MALLRELFSNFLFLWGALYMSLYILSILIHFFNHQLAGVQRFLLIFIKINNQCALKQAMKPTICFIDPVCLRLYCRTSQRYMNVIERLSVLICLENTKLRRMWPRNFFFSRFIFFVLKLPMQLITKLCCHLCAVYVTQKAADLTLTVNKISH